jgi:hypothetical protein
MKQSASVKAASFSAAQKCLTRYGARKCITVFTDPWPEPAESSPHSHAPFPFVVTSVSNLLSFSPIIYVILKNRSKTEEHISISRCEVDELPLVGCLRLFIAYSLLAQHLQIFFFCR